MSPPVVTKLPLESLAVTVKLMVSPVNIDEFSKPVTIEFAALAPVRDRWFGLFLWVCLSIWSEFSLFNKIIHQRKHKTYLSKYFDISLFKISNNVIK